jgi:DNA gyrase subunit B
MSEDFFFACISLKTKVFLLDGRTLTLTELIEEYKNGKENWTYSINQKTGRMIPGKIDWAGITRRNADMVRVHLDNGESIDCTPDHKFVLKDGSEVEAQFLTSEMSLMPIYKKKYKTNKTQRKELYERIVDNSTGKWTFTHLEICPKQNRKGTVIHHLDYNPSNNSPNNLVELTHDDHWTYHHSPGGHTLGKLWREDRQKMLDGIRNYHDNRTEDQTQTLIERNRINGSRTWELYPDEKRKHLDQGRETSRNKFETYEEYCKYMSDMGRSQWTDEKKQLRSIQTKDFNKRTKSYFIDDVLFQMFVDEFNDGSKSMPTIKKALSTSTEFIEHFSNINKENQKVKHNVPLKFSDKFIYKLTNYGGYSTFKEFKETYNFNHKITKIEHLSHKEDTGCLHVVDENNNHNFAIEAGVYIKNSRPDGRGSRVETLPGARRTRPWRIIRFGIFPT